MKLNNKGFLITGILYSLLLLFLVLIIGMLSIVSARQNKINYIEKKIITKLNDKYELNAIKTWNFDYTGNYQTFVAPTDGYYRIDLWGASGGYEDETLAGKGAYTRGTIYLTKGETLYVYVGGYSSGDEYYIGGYNGGGFGTRYGISNGYSYSGGGATDIRIINGAWNNFDSLKSRIMVAAGGAGEHQGTILAGAKPGDGGTFHGGDVSGTKYSSYMQPIGATQISGGIGHGASYNGKYGMSIQESPSSCWGSGGGGGYYGGAYGCGSVGSGGSSFISGLAGCDAIAESSTESNIVHTGQANHYSGKVFSDAYMVAGNSSMPTHDMTSTMTGNTGNGYAKISLLKETSNTDKILVTFDAAGGRVDVTGKEVAYGETYGDLPTPTREGYTFKGWNGKNIIKPLSNSITLYGITVTPQNDGSIILNGTKTGGDNYLGDITSNFRVQANVQYIVSIGSYDSNIISDYGLHGYGSGKSINWSVNFVSAGIQLYVSDGTIISNVRLYPQLEEGNVATAYEPYYIKDTTTVVQNQNHTLKAIWEPINYGSSIQSSYSTIYYSLNQEPKTQVNETTTGTWTGSFSGTNNIISLVSNSGSSIITPTNNAGSAVAVYSGTNTVNFTTQQLNKWVCLYWHWGERSMTKQLGNIKLLFNNNQNYTISQAVSNEYIEPLVPYMSSGSRVNDMSYVLDNPEQLLTGGSQIKAYSKFQVCFKVKKLSPLKAVNFETNGDWVNSRGGDGFNAYSSNNIEFSL